MSDEAEELAKRLDAEALRVAAIGVIRDFPVFGEASQLLRSQSATIERLREALKRLEPWDNLGIARAALEQSS